MIDLEKLNPEQRAAVEHTDGPLLVLAGAGSGKTRTLTYRIAHILERGLASPHGILAITFTRKAAWELRRRLEELVGKTSADITAVTFHSLGYKILCAESGALGFKPAALAICDASEARRLLIRAMKETGLDRVSTGVQASPDTHSTSGAPPANRSDSRGAAQGWWDVEQVAAIIERAKDNLYGPRDFVRVRGDFFEESVAKVYTRYQQLLKENNAVDYGDLIRLSVELLRENPQTLAFYQQLFRYVSVDEFQDSSFGQYQLIRLLVWGHHNLCCVGSPVQAIYSWRGADIANILQRFQEDFSHAPTVVLHANYRCSGNILNAAQQVVQKLPYGEELMTDNPPGDLIAVAASHTDWDEANYIAAEIQRVVEEAHYRYEDCAVLFRTRSQGRVLEQVLMHRGLPYTLVGDFRFFERREIKDLLAYLRLIHDLFDSGALQRIINRPPRGLGPAALAKLQAGEPELTFAALSGLERRTDLPERVKAAALEFSEMVFDEFAVAAKEKPLPELVDFVLERSGYLEWAKSDPEAKQRLANLAQLRVLTQRFEGVPDALSAFLADLATMANEEVGLTTETNGVTLATIHAVKGLEFPILFLSGCEEGILPHAKALRQPGGIDEEQRLAYVGMTRAMAKLYFTYARTRQNDSAPIECTPSRFLTVLPREIVERVSASIPATITPAPVCAQAVDNSPETVESGGIPIIVQPEAEAYVQGVAAGDDEPTIVASEPDRGPESEFDQWLGEGQSALLEWEVEATEEAEACILAEVEGEDTDLEAEILDEWEFEISEEVEAWLAEAQRELLEYEMELAEIAYERDLEMQAKAATLALPGKASAEKVEEEEETEDFDALLREYAGEIREHAREVAAQAQGQETM